MRRGLNLIITLGILAVGLIACSPTAPIDFFRQEVQSDRDSSASRQGTDADSAAQAKIQVVIARANFEQEQAFTTKDPAVMKGSATDRYYRQMVQNNQDLVDGNVTTIKLVAMEWGGITVRRNAAVATTWETWSTTFANGETRESRDRNDYRLILQSGAWKIDGDTHGGDDDSSPLPPGSRQI